jgi:predicted RNA binding protein YcfA (HicA-like mRNA interferase family)
MKYRQIIGLIRKDGLVQVAQRGSHRQFNHPLKRGRVTVGGKADAETGH